MYRALSKGALVGLVIIIIVIAAAALLMANQGGQQATTTVTTPVETSTPTATATAAPEVYKDTAVLIVAFESDGTNIIQHAAQTPILSKVRWFSSESIRSEALTAKAPEVVRNFLNKVKLTGTFPYMPKTKYLEELKGKLEEKGITVEGFVPYAYDAAMLGMLAIIKAGTTDADAVKQALLEVSKEYCGMSGWKALDPKTGDLEYQDYSIWTYECSGGECKFVDKYIYVAAEDKIVPIDQYKPSLDMCKITPDNIKEYIAEWIKNTNLKGEIVIGILLPQSGGLAVEGQNMIKAALYAIEQVNEILKELGAPFTFKPVVQDTGTKPQQALQGARVLVEQYGAKLIIGTASSAALSGIIDYVNEHKVITISPSSTSPALAKDDYVFRVVGNDRGQGKALAKLVNEEGVKKVVVIYRKDPYGEGIALAFKENFEALGGTVKLLGYTPDKPDYGPEVKQLANMIEELVKG
ncbi:Extracellular ligand-binding receptor [Pyrolobus fumarii 1A]|uniref:Extracellular ligand-binding receptor n=1 Tax=Pyrolobus fumarii (strain DSM 11204 / 1A) TaxID=694429 RepID=G0ED39_PYRF1|nr:ABC transporter substrate-binding protein [Pyrolobus fumarii]AEM38598.1 Extracellular ligand-binding receptor [Pyrolobus fumarii 1A]